MAPRLVSDTDLIDRLTDLFRTTGFEGSSLADIAAATGLQKSSLYHRFPGGKQQMALEVIDSVAQQFADDVLAPLGGSQSSIEGRIRSAGGRLKSFYDNGAKSCLLDVLSVGRSSPQTNAQLAAMAGAWVKAFAAVARSAGADAPTSMIRAQDAIASVEGALVVARVTGDRRVFARAIQRLPAILAPGSLAT